MSDRAFKLNARLFLKTPPIVQLSSVLQTHPLLPNAIPIMHTWEHQVNEEGNNRLWKIRKVCQVNMLERSKPNP